MNNNEKSKFLGVLYDIIVSNDIKSYDDKPKDLKEKISRLNEYLDKLKRVQDKAMDNERYLDMIKKLYYDRYVIKEESISDNYLRSIERQYLEEGYGYVNLVNPKTAIDEKLRRHHIAMIIKEQMDSLDNWLNYFLSRDSEYLPMWVKVWAFQGMLQIGNLNKEKDGYDKRSKTTVNPFVSFDSEILGRCVELINESFDKRELTDEEVKKLVESGSFAKIYGKLLAMKKQVKVETTDGIWIKYTQESEKNINVKIQQGLEPEYIKLYKSLQGYNTGWCTAGSRETAKIQLQGGDFYVYYLRDMNGEYKIPRLAIRMDRDEIGEIRGIASGQNIESNMEEILEEKLKEFLDASMYKKKVSDMKKLTNIYNKYLSNEELTKEDLRFLYEIDELIHGFGYDRDPRISEVLEKRDKKRDLSFILDCSEDEIIINLLPDNISDYELVEKLSKKIKYFEGNIDLSNLTSTEGLVLPEIIRGNLKLGDLRSANGLVLPEKINGDLDLSGLRSVKGLKLPKILNGSLRLGKLRSVKGLVLPEIVEGNLFLDELKNVEGLVFPKIINGNLDLCGLESVKELKLPKFLNGRLRLGKLRSAEDLILPEKITGGLDLSSLINAKGLVFPKKMTGILFLSNLISGDGLVLPEVITGGLDLSSLINAKGLVFPKKIDGNLRLRRLKSVEGLVLPKVITGRLDLSGLRGGTEGLVLPEILGDVLFHFRNLVGVVIPDMINEDVTIRLFEHNVLSLKKAKELQMEQSKIEIGDSKTKVLNRTGGYVTNILLLINIILFGILTFIIGFSILFK